MRINVKKLNKDAVTPERGSAFSAGYDLYACISNCESVDIQPHTTLKVGTGIAAAIPNGYFGAVFARSGIATKQGLRPANCVGVIDSDYRGEIIVPLHNDSDMVQRVANRERVAQLIILPFRSAEFSEVEELDETGRGDGGFGSTGRTGMKAEGK